MGRQEVPAPAAVSLNPTESPPAEVIVYGAESGGGGVLAAESSGGGAVMQLIYLTVRTDSFQSVLALLIVCPSVHSGLCLPAFLSTYWVSPASYFLTQYVRYFFIVGLVSFFFFSFLLRSKSPIFSLRDELPFYNYSIFLIIFFSIIHFNIISPKIGLGSLDFL